MLDAGRQLPRLRDSGALLGAVRDGVASLTWNPETFAYASTFEETTGRYHGLVAATHPAAVIDGLSLIVKPDAAFRKFESDRQLPPDLIEPISPDPPDPKPIVPVSKVPVRFYGRVTLGPVRLLKDMGEVAEAIIAQLSRADADVTITVEIEADAPKGFDDGVRRTVTENARTLKFDTLDFEAE